MWAEYLLAFLAGAVGHKAWRAAWRTRRARIPFRRAVAEEFRPPEPERQDKRKRPPRVTEVA